MRVIAGVAKGRRLAAVPTGIRPVSDRAREGIFSSLSGWVAGVRVLDLYAGSGAMGIEALSRGADEATFVDRSKLAAGAVRDNLSRTGLSDRARVVVSDVVSFLLRVDRPGAPFDLVVLDPPYETSSAEVGRVLAALANGWLAGETWSAVLTRASRNSTYVIPVDWALARRLEYGDSLATVYRPARRP